MTTEIGPDIRALRKARKWTLKELADQIGRSVGWLSQVERGQTVPSVQDLSELAHRFGISVSFFFRSAEQVQEERGVLVRRDTAQPIGSAETGLTETLLSPSLDGAFEIIRSRFAPRSESGPIRPRADREDGGVVLSGRLALRIDGQWFELGPGDSFQFKGGAYEWRNPGEDVAEVIWIVSPPVY
ncbi:MAG: XRE family transcriptional regulator [Pseudomonadota bacterium]